MALRRTIFAFAITFVCALVVFTLPRALRSLTTAPMPSISRKCSIRSSAVLLKLSSTTKSDSLSRLQVRGDGGDRRRKETAHPLVQKGRQRTEGAPNVAVIH